jgi:hypothetical protein
MLKINNKFVSLENASSNENTTPVFRLSDNPRKALKQKKGKRVLGHANDKLQIMEVCGFIFSFKPDHNQLVLEKNGKSIAYNLVGDMLMPEPTQQKDEMKEVVFLEDWLYDFMHVGYGVLNPSPDQTQSALKLSDIVDQQDHIFLDTIPYDLFRALLNRPELLVILNNTFGENNWHMTTLCAKKHDKEVRWHRDYPHNHQNIEDIPYSLQVNCALDPFTRFTGATQILLGTHLDSGFPAEAMLKILEGDPGTVFVYDAALLHEAGVNFAHARRNIMLANFSFKSVQKKHPVDFELN